MPRRHHRSHRHRGGPPEQTRVARTFVIRLVMFLVKIAIVVFVSPFVLLLGTFMAFILPNGAGARVVVDLFSRLFDKLFGPHMQGVIITGKRRGGFFDW